MGRMMVLMSRALLSRLRLRDDPSVDHLELFADGSGSVQLASVGCGLVSLHSPLVIGVEYCHYRSGKCAHVSLGDDEAAANPSDHLATATIVGHDNRSPAEDCFNRDKAEDFVLRWIHDHVRVGKSIQPLSACHEARANSSIADLEGFD